MIIGGRQIGPYLRPYIVAELSGNHNGNLDTAKEIIAGAKEAGADAIKFQLYDPFRLANARGGYDKEIVWRDEPITLGQLYQAAHTPVEWLPELIGTADGLGLTWFASVFDKQDVEAVKPWNPPAYKISSFDVANKVLLATVAAERKPTIISCGLASDDDIGHAIHIMARGGGVANVALLHCISAYPAHVAKTKLWRIEELRRKFMTPVGWSDHTDGDLNTASVAAVAMGACIIERHIMSHDGYCEEPLDMDFSLTPGEFSNFVDEVLAAFVATSHRSESTSPYEFLKVVS